MRLLDIERQKKWCEQVEVTVRCVGEPCQSQDTGSWEQIVEIADSMGREEVLHYYWEDLACTDGNPMGSIPLCETGTQFYRIKWTGNYFRCQPAKAPPKESLNAEARQPTDWNKVNLGKCRHGILVAEIQKNGIMGRTPDEWKLLKQEINELARFSMTGEIE